MVGALNVRLQKERRLKKVKFIENRCCDCAVPGYPCLGSLCSRRRVEVHYCDKCDEQINKIYEVDGKELCVFCFEELNETED